MNNKPIKTLLFLSLFFLAYPVHAAIEPPFAKIQYCAQITNIAKYPNFVLISRPTLEVFTDEQSGGYQQLSDKTCFTRGTRERIFAIKKSDFKKSAESPWSEQSAYFKSLGPKLLDSQVEISVAPLKSYNTKETRKSIVDEYSIASLDASHFSLSLDKRLVAYTNGHTGEFQNPYVDPLTDSYEITPMYVPKESSVFVRFRHWFISSISSVLRIF